MTRDAVQFHWNNQSYETMEAFLDQLTMKRRKNIRRERKEVVEAGVQFRHVPGEIASEADWAFFYRCYANTYLEHHSSPYLNEEFFQAWGQQMPEHLHLIVAEKEGRPVAASLLVVDKKAPTPTAYGRYWGSIEYIPCLHLRRPTIKRLNTAYKKKSKFLKVAPKVSTKWRGGFYRSPYSQPLDKRP